MVVLSGLFEQLIHQLDHPRLVVGFVSSNAVANMLQLFLHRQHPIMKLI